MHRLRAFRDKCLKHQLVGLLECVANVLTEPLRAAVERMEGAKNVDRRIGIANDEHRRLVGSSGKGRARRRCGG